MSSFLPFLVFVGFAVAAWLFWSACVYGLYRDPSAGNGFDRNGRPRPLGFRQVIGPFSRRKAERILALSRTQRTRAAWLRLVLGLAVVVLIVVVLIVMNRYGLSV